MKERKFPILHTFEYCDTVEEKDGKRSLKGLFLFINVLALPANHPCFHVILGFSKGIGKFKGKLVIRGPSRQKITSTDFEIEIPNQHLVCYSDIKIHNLPLMELGPHSINAYLGKKKVGEREFFVNIQDIPELNKEKIEELLKRKNTIKRTRAVFTCPKCGSEYSFQLNLNPDEPIESESLPFPSDNIFRCPHDSYEINLEGIKLSLKRMLGKVNPEKTEGVQECQS